MTLTSASNLTGMTFGRLTATTSAGRIGIDNRQAWVCICQCGASVVVTAKRLISEHTKSCGCIKREGLRLVHGHKRRDKPTRTYVIWESMNRRCYTTTSDSYALYGGRGIKVCDRWRDSFEAFLADMGKCPEGMSIDRIDSSGDYTPDNCRWATKYEQANNRSNNRRITIAEVTKTVAEWAEWSEIPYGTLYSRFRRGWNPLRAVGIMEKQHEVY